MFPRPARLDPVMQLVDVMGYCDQDTLRQNISIPPVQVLSEVHIFLHSRKGAFHLYTPVHPELDPSFTEDALKILFPFLLFCF